MPSSAGFGIMSSYLHQYHDARISFLLPLTLFLSISYFYFGTYRNWPYKIESDGKYYYQYLVSALEDKDFDFTNNYNVERYEWMRTDVDHYMFRRHVITKTGKPINLFSVGPAILLSPSFIITSVFGKILSALHYTIDMNPFGKYFQYTTMYAGVLYCIVALYLLFYLLKSSFHDDVSKYTIWLILLATPLYYYTIFEVSMSHVYDFFTFTLVLFLFVRCSTKKSIWYFIMIGLVSSLHVLVRTQNIVTIFVGGCLLIFQLRYEFPVNRFLLMKIGLSIMFFLFGVFPIPLINNYLYGHPFIIPQGNDWLILSNPQIFSVLFSPRNGLFSHHPILLIGFIGYIGLVISQLHNSKNISWMMFLFGAFIAQVYINSCVVTDWWGGHSYGQRRLVFSLPIFAFGIAYWLEKIRVHYPTIYDKFTLATTILLGLFGFYLTMIHVFFWDYEQPHNILKWMFYYAPMRIWTSF